MDRFSDAYIISSVKTQRSVSMQRKNTEKAADVTEGKVSLQRR